jgi:hypothetical protein
MCAFITNLAKKNRQSFFPCPWTSGFSKGAKRLQCISFKPKLTTGRMYQSKSSIHSFAYFVCASAAFLWHAWLPDIKEGLWKTGHVVIFWNTFTHGESLVLLLLLDVEKSALQFLYKEECRPKGGVKVVCAAESSAARDLFLLFTCISAVMAWRTGASEDICTGGSALDWWNS